MTSRSSSTRGQTRNTAPPPPPSGQTVPAGATAIANRSAASRGFGAESQTHPLKHELWEDSILALIGDQFDEEEGIVGMVLSVRGQEDILSVWSDREREGGAGSEKVDTVRAKLVNLLGLPPTTVCDYKSNRAQLEIAAQKASAAASAAAAATTAGHVNGGSTPTIPAGSQHGREIDGTDYSYSYTGKPAKMTMEKQATLKTSSTPSSTYASLIDQTTAIVPEFILESGQVLHDVPVAYKTWGKMNDEADNVMVICHALTGSADVEDWWGPLLGPGKAFDPTRYFIFCANVIGSPYGTVSSVTINPETGLKWGPEMPGSCVKDDVRLHKIVLDSLQVKSVAVVIGGSMGGMTCLEYALNTPPGYIKHIVPIATSARHSAWCISWGEAQRQSIYSDPAYDDGYYCYDNDNDNNDDGDNGDEERQPTRGLAAARMAALLTYRSRDSFESRFGRKSGAPAKRGRGGALASSGRSRPSSPPGGGAQRSRAPGTPREHAWRAHNDGHRARVVDSGTMSVNGSGSPAMTTPTSEVPQTTTTTAATSVSDQPGATGPEEVALRNPAPLTNLELSMPGGGGSRSRTPQQAADGKLGTGASRGPQVFSAQSYLRYQGDKFTSRFDANCYIHITRKMDTHDISFPTAIQSDPPTLSQTLPEPSDDPTEAEQTAALVHALSLLPPALVIGIESDGLFTTREQREIAASIPESELAIIPSPDGHDGFLLEFEAINEWVQRWLHKRLPQIYEGAPIVAPPSEGGFDVKKESLFGEAEADLTRW
ncbi:hypothetical protein QFC22_004791 [Naganishia vaughanmartiniae]|uniref:Uncharacterized protein n=1 Tax=Naganishia vaughanmartiniae TaxID=1424756 RepID=A0ACC2WX53_9TREE|nr:hypothetical protein QFC22_004791 [Naganishia vaughanmartiniae]